MNSFGRPRTLQRVNEHRRHACIAFGKFKAGYTSGKVRNLHCIFCNSGVTWHQTVENSPGIFNRLRLNVDGNIQGLAEGQR